jgi:hypothetical protein
LSSLEPNMEDGYLTVATRHKGAPANKYSMQNRLCFIQLVTRNILSRRHRHLKGRLIRRTGTASSAKTQSLADKLKASAGNPYNLSTDQWLDRRGRQ